MHLGGTPGYAPEGSPAVLAIASSELVAPSSLGSDAHMVLDYLVRVVAQRPVNLSQAHVSPALAQQLEVQSADLVLKSTNSPGPDVRVCLLYTSPSPRDRS